MESRICLVNIFDGSISLVLIPVYLQHIPVEIRIAHFERRRSSKPDKTVTCWGFCGVPLNRSANSRQLHIPWHVFHLHFFNAIVATVHHSTVLPQIITVATAQVRFTGISWCAVPRISMHFPGCYTSYRFLEVFHHISPVDLDHVPCLSSWQLPMIVPELWPLNVVVWLIQSRHLIWDMISSPWSSEADVLWTLQQSTWPVESRTLPEQTDLFGSCLSIPMSCISHMSLVSRCNIRTAKRQRYGLIPPNWMVWYQKCLI